MHPIFRPFSPKLLTVIYILLSLTLCSAAQRSAVDNLDIHSIDAHVRSLINQADSNKLASHPYWQILLHYQDSMWGPKSLIDDSKFFLSAHGKTDPKEELMATINFLFGRKNLTQEDVCRFGARFEWLVEMLGIDKKKLRYTGCDEIDAIEAKSATLIFPSYHMNSPASMFGHTLINIETDYEHALLMRSVNYAAHVEDTSGIVFAFKGIFGYYDGFYSILPYYKKIQEYSDIGRRDIWEYKLNLTPVELRRMALHIRELNQIASAYYFFDENCSYNLLFLLESARPSLHLTDRPWPFVIPVDTIKAIDMEGLIDSVHYRPSQSTEIKYKLSRLTEDLQAFTYDLALGRKEPENLLTLPITDSQKIDIADIAIAYHRYRYIKRAINQENYKALFLRLLNVRSRLKFPPSGAFPQKPPIPPRPDLVHDSNKLNIGYGFLGAGKKPQTFVEFGYRPAFCDLTDTDYGYEEGTQIQFGDMRLRYYQLDKRLYLERLHLIDIVSLPPRDRFFRPVSWKVIMGFQNKRLSRKKDSAHGYQPELSTAGFLNGGGGLAYYHKYLDLLYLMGEGVLDVHGNATQDHFSLGGGMSVGMINRINSDWKAHLSARSIFYLLGNERQEFSVTYHQEFKVKRNNSLSLSLSWEKVYHISATEAVLGWNIFF